MPTTDQPKITINRKKCISCGSCTIIAPQTFELDKDLIGTVKEGGPLDNLKTIQEAADGCPGRAITLEDKIKN